MAFFGWAGSSGGTIGRRPVPSTSAQPWWVLRRWHGDAEPVQGAELGEVGVGPVDAVIDLEVAGGATALTGALAADPVQDDLLAGVGPAAEVGDVEHVDAIGDDHVDPGLGQQARRASTDTGPSPSISQTSPATVWPRRQGGDVDPAQDRAPAARPARTPAHRRCPGRSPSRSDRRPRTAARSAARRTSTPRAVRGGRPDGPCRTRPAPTAPAGRGAPRWSSPGPCRGTSPPPRPHRSPEKKSRFSSARLAFSSALVAAARTFLALPPQLRHRHVLRGVQQLQLRGRIRAGPGGHLMGLGRRQLPVPQGLIGRRRARRASRRSPDPSPRPSGTGRCAWPTTGPSSPRPRHRPPTRRLAGPAEPRARREPIQSRQPLDPRGGLGRAQSVRVEVGAEPAQPGLDLGQRSERVAPGGVGVGRVEHLPPTLPTGCDSQTRKSGGFDEEIPTISTEDRIRPMPLRARNVPWHGLRATLSDLGIKGCSPGRALEAIGIGFRTLFPPKKISHHRA